MTAVGRKVVVVGASAAGLRCAARLTRLRPEWTIQVVEAREAYSYGACGMPYVLSGDIEDASELRRSSYGALRDDAFFRECKGLSILARHRATGVDLSQHTLLIEGPHGRSTLEWDELVLATGARARCLPGQPEDPRIRTFHLLDDLGPIKERLARGQLERAIIVGAGLVGCELAEALHSLWGVELVLVEAAKTPLPGMLDENVAAIAAHQLREAGVDLRLGAGVERFVCKEEVGVVVAGELLLAQLVLVAVGAEPASELAKQAGAALSDSGAILVDERLATSQEHLWAVGDCIALQHAVSGQPCHYPLGSLANRQGRLLADILAGRDLSFPPVTGAMAVKLFDWNVAAVGLTRSRARHEGLDARSAWITTEQQAHYWPETPNLYLELVYQPRTRRVLGVQVITQGNACAPIDQAAAYIAHGATIDELAALEHAYAPPFAPALDPLAVAAFVAANQEEGVEATAPIASASVDGVLDLRLPKERARQAAPARRLLERELASARSGWRPEDGERWTALCAHGTRSAEFVRYLGGSDSGVRYLGGGLSWRRAAGMAEIPLDGDLP